MTIAPLVLVACTPSPAEPAAPGDPAMVVDVGVDTAAPAAPAAHELVGMRFLVEANFDGTGSCVETYDAGCDLWLVTLDLDGALLDVAQVTATPDRGEGYASATPDLRYVVYAASRGGVYGVEAIERATGEIDLLVPGGRAPDLDPSGTLLAWQAEVGTDEDEVYTAPASFSGGAPALGDPVRVTALGRARMPVVFPGARRLATYVAGDEAYTGSTLIVDLDDGAVFEFASELGCAHGTHAVAGDAWLCQEGVQMYRRTWDGAAWGELETFAYPSCDDPADPLLAEVCARFADCDRVSWGYPEYCGPDGHLLASMECIVDQNPVRMEVVEVDLAGGLARDLHGEVERWLGVDGTSRAAACVPAG